MVSVVADYVNVRRFLGTGAGLGIVDHLLRNFARFKSATWTRRGQLGTHYFNLSGLLIEPGCESLCLVSELHGESLYCFCC